jgi:hypothetical protein
MLAKYQSVDTRARDDSSGSVRRQCLILSCVAYELRVPLTLSALGWVVGPTSSGCGFSPFVRSL